MVPGTRRALRRIGRTNDVLTFVSQYARRRISRPRSDRWRRWSTFRRGCGPTPSGRIRWPGGGSRAVRRGCVRPLLLSVSRLVARKGQDTLIRAVPAIVARVPDRRCADRRRRARRPAGCGHRNSISASTTGWCSPVAVPWPDLPGALRRRRRVRHALPHPRLRPGRRGARNRLPRGVRRAGCRSSPGGPAGRRRRCGRAAPGLVVDGRDVAAVAAAAARSAHRPHRRRRTGGRTGAPGCSQRVELGLLGRTGWRRCSRREPSRWLGAGRTAVSGWHLDAGHQPRTRCPRRSDRAHRPGEFAHTAW